MITIREDGHDWTFEEHLYMVDYKGQRGIDLLHAKGVDFISRKTLAPADFGLCKNAAQVHGVPANRSILMAWEPPGNIDHLNRPDVRARFKNYLSATVPIGDPHHFSFPRGHNIIDQFFDQPRERLVCMISRDRTTLPGHEANDLYAFRRKIVAFFTQHLSPEEFHLYGRWPDSPYFKGGLPYNNDLGGFGMECPANKGGNLAIDGRYTRLPQFHYNICTENAIEPGWVTEKIWHAMAAGCIPIYLGAPDIDLVVPKGLYIDMRGKSLEDILHIMRTQTQAERDEMRAKIRAWLTDPSNDWFSSVRAAKKLLWAIGMGEPCR